MCVVLCYLVVEFTEAALHVQRARVAEFGENPQVSDQLPVSGARIGKRV